MHSVCEDFEAKYLERMRRANRDKCEIQVVVCRYSREFDGKSPQFARAELVFSSRPGGGLEWRLLWRCVRSQQLLWDDIGKTSGVFREERSRFDESVNMNRGQFIAKESLFRFLFCKR